MARFARFPVSDLSHFVDRFVEAEVYTPLGRRRIEGYVFGVDLGAGEMTIGDQVVAVEDVATLASSG